MTTLTILEMHLADGDFRHTQAIKALELAKGLTSNPANLRYIDEATRAHHASQEADRRVLQIVRPALRELGVRR